MAVITILPSGLKLEVEPGLSLLKAVSDQKLCWPQTCGGKAQCTTCAYVVVSGAENLSPMGRLEQSRLVERKGRHVLKQNVRLACQTIVRGDATVQKNIMVF